MLARRVFSAFGRSLRGGWRSVRRTLTNETVVTTTAYAVGLLTIAAGLGLVYVPIGVIFAGASILVTVVLYLRGKEESGDPYRPPGGSDE